MTKLYTKKPSYGHKKATIQRIPLKHLLSLSYFFKGSYSLKLYHTPLSVSTLIFYILFTILMIDTLMGVWYDVFNKSLGHQNPFFYDNQIFTFKLTREVEKV